MMKIRIDGKDYDVKPGKNLLETALALGLDIPHFCFHPALGSVGACRLCAVKKFRDENDTKGRIVMSCMEPVTEGLIVSIEDPDAKAFRAMVIEGLMTNHPHDCPVCDEGGECHLQDMTVMTGHNYRRYDFKKRTYNNQYLGPFINHEMNRCIQCYRCVRFYRDYTGGKDLNVFGAHNHVYFGRDKEGVLENEFSGNLAEVCPTGVFTDKTLKKHFTRKWDLSNSPSVCVHCSVGCNTIVSERYGTVRRILSRYNGEVNGYFLCDRGRFGYEFLNDKKRIRLPVLRTSNSDLPTVASEEKLLKELKKVFKPDNRIVGIGSPRASVEANYALMKLVGKENFYHGISEKEHKLTATIIDFFRSSGIKIPSLKEIEKADAILVLGEDLTNSAPMMALAIRQALRNVPNEEAVKKGIPLWNDSPVRELAQHSRSPLFILTSYWDNLDTEAEEVIRAEPEDLAGIGLSIAHILDSEAPEVKLTGTDNKKLAEKIAASLRNAKNPLIISGTGSRNENVLHSALNIAKALEKLNNNVMLSIVLPECNSMGLGMFSGNSFEEAFESINIEATDTLVILENDLFRRASAEKVNRLIEKCSKVIVLDNLENNTTSVADILIPAAAFAEAQGTLINNEGRAQRYYKALPQNSMVRESWSWIADFIKYRDDISSTWRFFDDLANEMAEEIPAFSGLKNYTPDASFQILNMKIARQPMRYSGRTAMNANISVSEKKVPQDGDSPLAFSMEGIKEDPPSSMVPFYWTPGWNSVQAQNSYLQEPGGSLKGGDPGLKLFGNQKTNSGSYYTINRTKTVNKEGELLFIPVYRIFGSEELSSSSPAVAELIKAPFILINNADALTVGIKESEEVEIELAGSKFKVKVEFENSMPKGVAGLSVNLGKAGFADIPGFGKINAIT